MLRVTLEIDTIALSLPPDKVVERYVLSYCLQKKLVDGETLYIRTENLRGIEEMEPIITVKITELKQK